MNLSLARVAEALGCPLTFGDSMISGWSIDSRTVAGGDLFIALHGENHDGHDYAGRAFESGAAAALVDREIAGRTIRVADTQKGLEALGAAARSWWNGTVVGVTGSAGKTSTKDTIAALLSVEYTTGRTIGNFNNHIGLPLSILRLEDDATIAVLEMGMNHAGEIRHLCKIAKPQFGVVTNAGHAHIEHFGTVDGIALAKRELIESLGSGGVAVLNNEDERVRGFAEVHPGRSVYYGFGPGCHVRGVDVELTPEATHFRVEQVHFQTALSGQHSVLNILAGIAVAREHGIPLRRLVEPVRALEPGRMRGERMRHQGVLILNDCYNSNPSAARAMLGVLRDLPARRRIAVLGEMLELGPWAEALHRDLGKAAVESGVSRTHRMRRRRSLRAVSAAREISVSASPARIRAMVATLHGSTTIAS